MTHTMIIWCIMASSLLCTIIFRTVESQSGKSAKRTRRHRLHLIEFGKEKEIFYIPGDCDDDTEDL